MSNHRISIEFESGYYSPTYTLTCEAPPEALCRAEWDCDCEAWDKHGVDEQGPWHEGTTWDDEESSFRHYGKPGGECGQILFVNESDCIDELGRGTVTVPVDLAWDGDGYEWHIVKDETSEADR